MPTMVYMEMLTDMKKVERKPQTFLFSFFWRSVETGREEGLWGCAQIPRKFKVREWRGWICQRRRVEGDVWKRKSKSLFTGV